MTPELAAACRRAIHVVKPDGEVVRAGRAGLLVLAECGHGWARWLAVPPFVWLVELGYWLVARNRRLAARVLFRTEDPDDPWRDDPRRLGE